MGECSCREREYDIVPAQEASVKLSARRGSEEAGKAVYRIQRYVSYAVEPKLPIQDVSVLVYHVIDLGSGDPVAYEAQAGKKRLLYRKDSTTSIALRMETESIEWDDVDKAITIAPHLTKGAPPLFIITGFFFDPHLGTGFELKDTVADKVEAIASLTWFCDRPVWRIYKLEPPYQSAIPVEENFRGQLLYSFAVIQDSVISMCQETNQGKWLTVLLSGWEPAQGHREHREPAADCIDNFIISNARWSSSDVVVQAIDHGKRTPRGGATTATAHAKVHTNDMGVKITDVTIGPVADVALMVFAMTLCDFTCGRISDLLI